VDRKVYDKLVASVKSGSSVKPSVTAALLAGGRSTRMGQDKAHLRVEWQGSPVFLWERQISILQAIGPDELIISGSRNESYPESVRVIPDEWEGGGPLRGIGTCLKHVRTDLLFVLAVDLARIQPEFLGKLLNRSTRDCGVVPFHENRFEPLVAVYPAAAVGIAIEQLTTGEFVLQRFVRRLSREGLITSYNVELSDHLQLTNWNKPADLE
jgi:molybdopterin-guanine dinucleotide biosynthesis protein A